MVAFADLSNDVLLSILQLLSVKDILSTRQTCRTLADISRRRILWLTALKTACMEDSVLLSSFPMSQMSTEDLEAVASGPSRFVSLLKHHGKQTTKAKEQAEEEPIARASGNTRSIRIQLTIRPSLFHAWCPPKFFIVPGGRFLIVNAETAIQLWDLSPAHTASSMEDPVLVCQHSPENVRGPQSMEITAGRTSSGRESIRITRFGGKSIEVLETCPADESPRLTALNKVSTDLRDEIYSSVCGNVIVILYTAMIKVWDFVEDTWACFKLESTEMFDPSRHDNYMRLVLSPGLICVVFKTGVSLWGIPILQSSGPDGPPSDAHKPLACLSFSPTSLPFNYKGEDWADVFVSGPPPWYSANGQPLWFDCNVPQKGSRQVQRFCLETTGDGSSQRYVLKEGSSKLMLSPESIINRDSSRMVGGKYATVIASGYGTACHYGMEIDGNSLELCPPMPLIDRRSAVGTLHIMFSSCPFSGRFCFYPVHRHDELLQGPRLDIVDLFPRA